MQNFKKQLAVAAVSGFIPLILAGQAHADFVANGDFTDFTYDSGAGGSASGGGVGYNITLNSWSSTGYNFLFTPATLTAGNSVVGNGGALSLWTTANGGLNTIVAPPNGGNVIANDGAFESGPLSQALTGLTVGQTYAVSFYWAAAQQTGFTGVNTEQWQVSLGSDTQTTPVYNNVSTGASSWMSETLDYTASSSSEVLSFLAIGTPISPSVPPFSLLTGVSVVPSPVPEPTTLVGGGVIALTFCGGIARRFRKKMAA